MPTIIDQSERLRVLTDLDSTLLVEAGAGTGKTALMAGRVAMLLAAGVPTREIAAITFTEAAASELFARIFDYSSELREGRIPPELSVSFPEGPTRHQTENLLRASDSLDELICSTIHSFCQQLTKPYPVEANLDPGAVIMDEVQADLAYDVLFEEWLRSELSQSEDDRPVAVLLVERGVKGRRLIEQIVAAQQNRRGAQSPSSRLSQHLTNDFRSAVAAFVEIYGRATRQGLIENTTSVYADGFQVLAEFYATDFQPDTSFRQLWRLTEPPDIAAFKKDGYHFRKYQCKGAWQEAARAAHQSRTLGEQFNNELSGAYDRVAQTLTSLLDALGETVLAQLTTALEGFTATYGRHKRSSAVLDFDDLLYNARDLLRRSPEVRAALSGRYRHILVDEFQDTDPVQAEILFLLCGEGPNDAPWPEMRLRPGQLFLVGDPKQSIYRFRRADIACYERVRQAFLEQFPGSKIQITANFRSQEPILTFVNDRFSAPLNEIGFAPLSCTLEGPPPSDPRVVRLGINYPPDMGAPDRRRAEATQVAQFCRHLLDNFQVRTKNGLQTCKPKHIALLAPSSTELWVYEQALEEIGIPLSTQAGKGLFRRQEIQDLIAITRVLSNRRDTFALGALLRGPLIGLSEEELLDIVAALPRRPESGDYVSISVTTDPESIPHPVARESLKILNSLSKRAYNTTPFDILNSAVEGLNIRPLLLQRHPRYAERTLANVDLFLDLARQYSVRGLRAFSRDMMRRWEDAERQIEGRTDAGVEALQIITVHAAKGLEWPVVIPINMITETHGAEGVLFDAQRNTLLCQFEKIRPAPYVDLKDAETEQLRKERLRMWYVTCTRARDMLVIPHHTNAQGAGSWFGEIDLRLAELQAAVFENVPPYASAPHDASNDQTLELFQTETEAMSRRTRRIHWTTPSLAEEQEGPSLPSDESLIDGVVSSPVLVAGSATRGRVLHKLMEEILLGAVTDDRLALTTCAASLIAQLGLDDSIDPRDGLSSRELADCALRTLSLPLVQKYRLQLVPEWNLYSSTHGEQGKCDAIAGIADAIAYGQTNQADFVFDWKSDVAPDNPTVQKHSAQLRKYLAMTGCKHGAIVYMTTGNEVEVNVESSRS